MAGAGRKTFIAGNVLTATEVNDYLMDQAVMRFATASARSTALPTPSEGMVSYLDDTNTLEKYDGSAWSGVGQTYAEYATSASAPLGLSVGPSDSLTIAATVTFPSGRFSVAPICQVTPGQYSSAIVGCSRIIYSAAATASAATIYFSNANISTSVSNVDFSFRAVQMTSGSAAG